MYIKIKDGIITYPYTIGELKSENPNVTRTCLGRTSLLRMKEVSVCEIINEI